MIIFFYIQCYCWYVLTFFLHNVESNDFALLFSFHSLKKHQ